MKSQPSLLELRALAAVASHRSFRRAAGVLGLAPSTLSHMMTQLEARLQTRLLNRTTRSVATTAAGARLVERLAPLLGGIDDALSDLEGERDEPSGNVRIAASETVCMLLMREAVPRFLERFPHASLDLVATADLVDVVAEGFDAGIRLGEAVPRDMVAVRVGGPSRMLPVATPAYLSGHRPPESPEDLRLHRCICSRTPGGRPFQWEFERDGETSTIAVAGPLTLNRTELMIDAALSGLGVAYVPERLAAPHLERGSLVAMLEAWCPAYPGLFIFYPGHRHVPAVLRALVSVLKDSFGRE
ncbi:LysR family transcriptional regulator [Sphingomonas sp. S2-65]|uniref:LysR family transcriptional regulator n=1 Tax=Sphingomonas sp. S2-65 TaxID=2903960 RepID=UPI001F1EC548|nr:LysR family transcriptional regulator [Sphingomonas sp. S2-65]UYY58055.1 LysR family transcriptional regulator [Sphingomonas sp. S2-65]